MLRDFRLSGTENFILAIHGLEKHLSIPDVKALQLDSANTIVEQVPIVLKRPIEKRIKQVTVK